jgi:hypothetical protein
VNAFRIGVNAFRIGVNAFRIGVHEQRAMINVRHGRRQCGMRSFTIMAALPSPAIARQGAVLGNAQTWSDDQAAIMGRV